MTPHRAFPPYDWAAVLSLIQRTFAYMDGRIDPPSSVHGMTNADIAAQSESGEVWVTGAPPIACMFLTPQADSLYLGKFAVAQSHRGKGHARRLIARAEDSARARGLAALTLKTRVELLENHATFRALGFIEVDRGAHPGYDRPTTVTFRKEIAPL